MPRLISRAELSRIAGVSDVAISKACKKQLLQACVGPRVDLDHATVVAYLVAKGRPPPGAVRATLEPGESRPSSRPPPDVKAAPGPSAERREPSTPVIEDGPENIEDIDRWGHLSLF